MRIGLFRTGDVVVLVVNWREKVVYVRLRNGPVISACKIDDSEEYWVSCPMRAVGDKVRCSIMPMAVV
jgi:hypothetical protein